MPGARLLPGRPHQFHRERLARRRRLARDLRRERSRRRATLTRAELARQIARAARALQAAGVAPGDRVAGMVANIARGDRRPLAAASIGAVWSSCSPDFGVQGVLDRFGQIAPRGAGRGRRLSLRREEVRSAAASWPRSLAQLPTVRQVVVIPSPGGEVPRRQVRFVGDALARQPRGDAPSSSACRSTIRSTSCIRPARPACPSASCTAPAARWCSTSRNTSCTATSSRAIASSTSRRCGWMMWNWLVTALASDATIVLYDGSPFHPDGTALFDLPTRPRSRSSARRRSSSTPSRKAGLGRARRTPRSRAHDHCRPARRSRRRASTTSTQHDQAGRASRLHLRRHGHRQLLRRRQPERPGLARRNPGAAALGMDVDVFDEDGQPGARRAGRTRLHGAVSVHAGRLLERSRTARKYRAAYFERFPGVWCHGDWLRVHRARRPHHLRPLGRHAQSRRRAHRHRGDLPAGRAAAGGRREPGVGQEWDGDERIVLFVRLRPGVTLDDALRTRIREADPREHDAAPRAGAHRAGRRHSAHQERQDRGAGGARRDSRPAGEESRGARQSRGARAVQGSTRSCGRDGGSRDHVASPARAPPSSGTPAGARRANVAACSGPRPPRAFVMRARTTRVEPASRFRVDDREHIALRRALRGFTPELGVIGAYHSHPRGRAAAVRARHPRVDVSRLDSRDRRIGGPDAEVRAFTLARGRATPLPIRWRASAACPGRPLNAGGRRSMISGPFGGAPGVGPADRRSQGAIPS